MDLKPIADLDATFTRLRDRMRGLHQQVGTLYGRTRVRDGLSALNLEWLNAVALFQKVKQLLEDMLVAGESHESSYDSIKVRSILKLLQGVERPKCRFCQRVLPAKVPGVKLESVEGLADLDLSPTTPIVEDDGTHPLGQERFDGLLSYVIRTHWSLEHDEYRRDFGCIEYWTPSCGYRTGARRSGREIIGLDSCPRKECREQSWREAGVSEESFPRLRYLHELPSPWY